MIDGDHAPPPEDPIQTAGPGPNKGGDNQQVLPTRTWPGLTAFLCGLLPLIGIGAGFLMTPIGASMMPTWFDLGATVWACVALLVADRYLWQRTGPRPIWLALLVGTGASVAFTFGVMCLPLLPMFLVALVMFVGVLALAPYWNLLGWILVIKRFLQLDVDPANPAAATAQRRAVWIMLAALLAYPGHIGWRVYRQHRTTQAIEAAELLQGHQTAAAEALLLEQLHPTDLAPLANGRMPGTMVPAVIAGAANRFGWARMEPRVSDELADLAGSAHFRATGEPAYLIARQGMSGTRSLTGDDVFALGRGNRLFVDRTDAADAVDARRGPIPALSFGASRMDLTRRDDGLVQARWSFRIRNHGASPRQSRLHFMLPPRGFVHDAQLQVQGRWRPAVFAPVNQAVQAYERIAAVSESRWNRNARDPLLVRHLGADRVRAVAFPVPRRSAIQFLLEFVLAPRVTSDGSLELPLPRLMDTDARLADTSHQVLLDNRELLTLNAADARDSQRCVIPWTKQTTDWIDQPESAWPRNGMTGAVIVDGFHGHGPRFGADLEAALLERLPPETACSVVSGDDHTGPVHRPGALRELAAMSGSCAFRAPTEQTGPRNRWAALARAIDSVASSGAGAEGDSRSLPPVTDILWIHGASTLHLPNRRAALDLEDLLRKTRSRLVVLPATTDQAPNRMVELLVARRVAIQAYRLETTLAADVARLLEGRGSVRGAPFTPRPGGAQQVPLPALLATAETMHRQLPAGIEAATLTAVENRILTRHVGAVVLERDDQYAQTGLTPPGDRPLESASPVPEPGTLLLVATGLIAVALWRRHRTSLAQNT